MIVQLLLQGRKGDSRLRFYRNLTPSEAAAVMVVVDDLIAARDKPRRHWLIDRLLAPFLR